MSLSPSDLAAQFELYAVGWEEDAKRRRARHAEHAVDLTIPGNREICLWETVHYTEADQAAHQLRNAARMVREFLVPRWTRDLPTKPGHYLLLEGGQSYTVRVIEVPSVGLAVSSPSAPLSVTHEHFAASCWCGPIPEPVDP